MTQPVQLVVAAQVAAPQVLAVQLLPAHHLLLSKHPRRTGQSMKSLLAHLKTSPQMKNVTLPCYFYFCFIFLLILTAYFSFINFLFFYVFKLFFVYSFPCYKFHSLCTFLNFHSLIHCIF